MAKRKTNKAVENTNKNIKVNETVKNEAETTEVTETTAEETEKTIEKEEIASEKTSENESKTVDEDVKAETTDTNDIESETTSDTKEESTPQSETETVEVAKETSSEVEETTEEVNKSEDELSNDTEEDIKDDEEDGLEYILDDEGTVEKEDKTDDKAVKTAEKSDETSKKAKATKKFTVNDLVWLLIGFICGIMISFFLLNITINRAVDSLSGKADNSIESTESTTEESEGVSTYTEPSTIIKGKDDMKKVQDSINEYIDGLVSDNTYSQVMVGNDKYIYYLHNTKGEVFSQDTGSTYTEIFLNNGKTYKYNSSDQALSVGNDIDVYDILKNSVNAIGHENVTLYDMDLTDTDAPAGHEYRIDLKGEEAVKLLYSSLGDEFANDMIDSIKESITDWEPHMIMVYFIGDEGTQNNYCFCLYVIDNKEYTNWFFQGYDTTESWELDEAWYDYDAKKDKDGKEYGKLADDLTETVNNIMTAYANSRGWSVDDIQNSESEASTNSTSTETSESDDSTEN